MPSVLRTRRLVLNVAAVQFNATFLLIAYLFAAARSADVVDHISTRTAILGLAASQATLLAAWLSLGGLSAAKRAVCGAAAALFLLLAYRLVAVLGLSLSVVRPFDEAAEAVTATLAPPMVAATAFGLLASRWGWRWRDEHAPEGPSVRFSLRALMIATVLIALVLALGRWLHSDFETFAGFTGRLSRQSGLFAPEAFSEALYGLALAASCLVAGAACVGPRPYLRFVIGAVAWGTACGFAWGWATESLHQGRSTAAAASGGFLAAVATMSSLLVLRSIGWRIDRTPQPIASKAAADER